MQEYESTTVVVEFNDIATEGFPVSAHRFPQLDPVAIRATRDALHAYARVLGGWLTENRQQRKHWWHVSLRPSLSGLTTGVVRAETDFELELDFVASQLTVRTPGGALREDLVGQSAASIASFLDRTLATVGIDSSRAPGDKVRDDQTFAAYSAAQAKSLHYALASVAGSLEHFRAGIREETSPIQLWPHHFDLSMLWLPGGKIAGQDPSNAEYSDKQMNFGFVFGDEAVAEPYFYVTAYPLPDALPKLALPIGTMWKSDGFNGAVLLYEDLIALDDPAAYLQQLWSILLTAGQLHLSAPD